LSWHRAETIETSNLIRFCKEPLTRRDLAQSIIEVRSEHLSTDRVKQLDVSYEKQKRREHLLVYIINECLIIHWELCFRAKRRKIGSIKYEDTVMRVRCRVAVVTRVRWG